MGGLMDNGWRVGLAAVMMSLGAGAAAASETHLWVRAGASDATVQADLAACRQQSLSVPVHVPASAETSAGLEPDSKAYPRASRLTPSCMAARLMKVRSVSARVS